MLGTYDPVADRRSMTMAPLTQLTSTDEGLQGPISTAADLPFASGAGWGPGPTGLYIHVPFCLHKCHYCDFYSLVETGPQSRRPAFTDRLIEEIRATAPGLWRPLETIFVGGGTPTLLAPDRRCSASRRLSGKGLGARGRWW